METAEEFNQGWSFAKEGEEERSISLPYDAMLFEKRAYANGPQCGFFPGGKYLYKKEFFLTKEDLKQELELSFGGVYRHSEVFLNDTLLGKELSGFTSFSFKINQAAHEGKNTLYVKVDNSLTPNARFYTGSGIYRKVYLRKRPCEHLTHVRVETLSLAPTKLRVSFEGTFKEKPLITISFQNKTVYEGQETEIFLEKASFWSADTPALYDLTIADGEALYKTRFGIRTIALDPAVGLLINSQRTILKGACLHADNGILGMNEYQEAAYRKLKIIKDQGFNAIRSAHNPCSEEILKAADELGLYLIDEAFDGWYIPKEYYDSSRDFAETYAYILQRMAEKDFNHPSVIMYSLGNEVSETAEKRGVEVAEKMVSILKQADPTRKVTAAINTLLNVYFRKGIGVYKEKGTYDPLKAKEVKIPQKKSGSNFFNFWAQRLGKLFFLISKGKKADEAISEVGEKLDVLGLNYSSSRYEEDFIKHPKRMILGTESLISNLPFNYQESLKLPTVIGDFIWAGFDYLGEAGVGAYDYLDEKGLNLLAGSGAIDILGLPGPEMAFIQLVWGLRKKPYIAIEPVPNLKKIPKKSAWRFSDAINSYDIANGIGKKGWAEIYTYSPYVELFLNGKSIGKKKTKNYRAVFRFKYQEGTLKAVGLNKQGQKEEESFLSSPKKETFLAVQKENYPAKELVYLDISLVDEAGLVKSSLKEEIQVKTEGEICLLALGNSNVKQEGSYVSSASSTFQGRLLAILRKKTPLSQGEVTVISRYGNKAVKID
ncbi:MAG: DUF4982 domain-containing protein [Bacilli bacterium]|jgi:hypothetical protein|nr:DUF4982 domain-containing protein [Bacilli bacterium]